MMLAMKIGLTVLLAAMPSESVSATGMATCKCLGTKSKFMCGTKAPPCIKELKCSHTWAVNGKCVNITSDSVKYKEYPYDYGDSCKKHHEVGSASCYNVSKNPPTELKAQKKEAWCDDKWCYVDCCACDAADSAYSHWFKPVKIPYSYATCGDSDQFTAGQDEKTGKCETKGCGEAGASGDGSSAAPAAAAPTSTEDASDAQMVARSLAMPVVLFSVWFMQ